MASLATTIVPASTRPAVLWMASNPRSSIQRPAPPARAVRSKASPAKRPAGATPRAPSSGDDADACRVRVAVRLRPRNNEDLHFEADCVELQPELRRLKLRKNNWISESYKFDEVFTENASQKRVYQVVAKPVVESVLNGFNGTVMAYGQTGTGKTYTIGRLGKSDQSERGIMVRAMEDILVDTSSAADTVAISYLQIYLESIQDLLAPEKKNIAIVDDPRTGQVFLPGAAVITVRDLDHFQQLLQIGESNRHVANTTMNTESSRSHAILMRSSKGKEECENIARNEVVSGDGLPVIIKSKLLIVDLAGSERIDKSGSEGHMLEEAKFINLSLTSLGKCINALSENSPHIPTRDSKLTRLLHDSFGGSARASLIITIGPSARYYAETASTIMFGQRAMKVVNMVKYKVEFDYESQCRKLQEQVDSLTEESERQQKFRSKEKEQMEEKLKICENSLAELEKNLTLKSEQHQLESFTYQKTLVETAQKYEERIADLTKQLEDMHVRYENSEDHLTCVQKLLRKNEKLIEHYQMEHSTYQKMLVETTQMCEKIIADLSQQLEEMNTSFANPEQPFPFDNGTSVQVIWYSDFHLFWSYVFPVVVEVGSIWIFLPLRLVFG
ncbi:hypothetical protein Taro_011794 [Colocasia esculenta]|uniref:Kinesin-like protein n=1 Tax=Colocasia esculenta TaxID=4460 RepID=A0A843UB41_COLES|nr:hypothetical protein [Colocasia esculenta]